MALSVYHATNYNGVVLNAEQMVKFYMNIIDQVKKNKINYQGDGISVEAERLKRALYDHFFVYAQFLDLGHMATVWKKHTQINAFLVGEENKTFYWELLIDDIEKGRGHAIQIPCSETSSHLPASDLMLVVLKLAEEKFLKMYTHVNAAKVMNFP